MRNLRWWSVIFVDNWLGDIMTMLDEAGISNSTLVVIVGDHGQAFGEDNKDMIGTYENGHTSNYRVPIVFRHPHMPRINIDANATSISIIPTILDLLVQSHSLDARDSEMASALLPDYQGQSLIRPFIPYIKEGHDTRIETPSDVEARSSRRTQPKVGHRTRYNWNFGIVNAGGSMVSVTAAGLPYRLVLPFKEGFEYVFSDLNQDPGELHLKLWTMKDLVDDVMSKHEASAAEWLEDAEQVGKWWVNEQRRIWGYRES
ncbi:Alkaline-phosphatase-like, core domain [Penicillium camemberti]|uniref:Alkaline-phosphatase-like, core domain n=1 Tax=Penicillium camemberti (strain FM 013) TaxID=1429867 RepID=A0A0G4PXJ3_PENC3|nr:Alkaline-phosphatase-like, core domain [Penicillium camemberti]